MFTKAFIFVLLSTSLVLANPLNQEVGNVSPEQYQDFMNQMHRIIKEKHSKNEQKATVQKKSTKNIKEVLNEEKELKFGDNLYLDVNLRQLHNAQNTVAEATDLDEKLFEATVNYAIENYAYLVKNSKAKLTELKKHLDELNEQANHATEKKKQILEKQIEKEKKSDPNSYTNLKEAIPKALAIEKKLKWGGKIDRVKNQIMKILKRIQRKATQKGILVPYEIE